MPILFILSIILQAALIVHCIKTGRNTIWIWVIALLSYAGIAAYLFVEVLPALWGSRTARRAGRSMKRMLDPHGDLRRYEQQARVGVNVANLQQYAEELVRKGRYDEAIAEYRKALTGLYENDPNLMLGVARAQFEKGDATAARTTLDDLIRLNPDFRSHEGHLLYARALEGEGDFVKALDEYKALAPGYPGAEAAVRYAQLLKAQGQDEESRNVARELLDGARIAPAHYRRAQRSWLDLAERLAAG
jgi:hypothetical protein